MSDAYGSIARFYDKVVEPFNAPLRSIGRRLHPVGAGDSVLDVGCGTGMQLAGYVDQGADCHGIDLSPAMLEVAAQTLGDTVELTLGSATSMPYADDRFDLVLASLMLHELPPGTRSAVLGEMSRVVRPGGRVLITDFRAGDLRLGGRVRRLVSHLLERAAGAEHYRQWRAYQRTGGLPAMLPPSLEIEQEKIVSGGNMAVWLIAPVTEW